MTRFSQYFLPTLKEESSSPEIPSYILALKAGLIRKIAAGIYIFLPLGLRVLKKIEKIVREEMDKTGAVEILMPALQPSDLWKQSGRWQQYGPELFRLKDRNEREFCLGPTHEELITFLAFQDIKSYRDMPLNLYQIQVKFRDEVRPRYGILRAREFIMKDAYSFTSNEEDMDDIYKKMYKCYSNIIERLNLKYFAVEADTGLIGGKYSHEFIILAGNGEDEIVFCPGCGYAANYEMARFVPSACESPDKEKRVNKISEVYTPGVTSIKSLEEFLKVPSEKIIKTMLLKGEDGTIYAFLLRGDRELNIPKAEKAAGNKLEMLGEEALQMGFNIGFTGPCNLDGNIKKFADISLKNCVNMVTGANKKDYHLTGVNYPENFDIDIWGDFTFALSGDRCVNCSGELKYEKGIEVGHIFKLGTRYSEKMDAMFLDHEGKLKPIIMGCYGIGVSRILSAVIEQLFDDKGILWPASIAPYKVNLIAINMEDEGIITASEEIYGRLLSERIEVIYDDRNVRAGVKFKDSDLIGIPLKLIVGKNYFVNKKLEIELRKDGSKFNADLDGAVKFIREYS
ncbi:MAG: proline--tRNA ligase [Actinobacteria bacterium]|nr:proline--tRNA ligase [Actinomycetota bacterium]